MKYKKKPIVIEAIQYNNRNRDEVEDFVGKKLKRELPKGKFAYRKWPLPMAGRLNVRWIGTRHILEIFTFLIRVQLK